MRLVLFLAHHQHLLKIGPQLPSNRLMSFDASLRMLDIFFLSKTVKLSYKIFMVEVFLKVIVVVVLSFIMSKDRLLDQVDPTLKLFITQNCKEQVQQPTTSSS